MEKELNVLREHATESCCDPVCGPETCSGGPTLGQRLIRIITRSKPR